MYLLLPFVPLSTRGGISWDTRWHTVGHCKKIHVLVKNFDFFFCFSSSSNSPNFSFSPVTQCFLIFSFGFLFFNLFFHRSLSRNLCRDFLPASATQYTWRGLHNCKTYVGLMVIDYQKLRVFRGSMRVSLEMFAIFQKQFLVYPSRRRGSSSRVIRSTS